MRVAYTQSHVCGKCKVICRVDHAFAALEDAFKAPVDHICFYFSLAEFMPQVKVEPVETVEGCTHEVFKQIPPDNLTPSKSYLNFQILCQMMINNLK